MPYSQAQAEKIYKAVKSKISNENIPNLKGDEIDKLSLQLQRMSITEENFLASAAKAVKNGRGNCGENAALALVYALHEACSDPNNSYVAEFFSYPNDNGDHAFVVLNRASNVAVPPGPKWPADVFIVDAWGSRCYDGTKFDTVNGMAGICYGATPLTHWNPHLRSNIRIEWAGGDHINRNNYLDAFQKACKQMSVNTAAFNV
jgi:hypothetical protein